MRKPKASTERNLLVGDVKCTGNVVTDFTLPFVSTVLSPVSCGILLDISLCRIQNLFSPCWVYVQVTEGCLIGPDRSQLARPSPDSDEGLPLGGRMALTLPVSHWFISLRPISH